MRFYQADSIVLDVIPLADADRIVVFLTQEHGKRRGVARGARRRYSRFAGELQPLVKARIGWFEKEGRDLVRVTRVEPLRFAATLQKDLEGILLGAYLAEHLVEFAQENEPSETLFRLLDSTLTALAAGLDRDLAARYFETWVLRLAGIFPAPVECPQCGSDLTPGAALVGGGQMLVCRSCGAGDPGALPVSAAAIDLWRRAGREGLTRMAASPPATATLREVEEVAGRVRRHFLQHELKSYGVMRRTLAAV